MFKKNVVAKRWNFLSFARTLCKSLSSSTYFVKTYQSLIAEIPRQSVFPENVPAPYKLFMWLKHACFTATGKRKFQKKKIKKKNFAA